MPSLLRFLMAMTFNFGGKVRPAFGLQSRFEIGGGAGESPYAPVLWRFTPISLHKHLLKLVRYLVMVVVVVVGRTKACCKLGS